MYDVYGVGNALVDLVVPVRDDLLRDLLATHAGGKATKGSMTLMDQVGQQRLLADVESLAERTVAGGSGANSMFGIAQLGGRPRYAGKVGNDRFGNFFAQEMNGVGVHFDVPAHAASTGTCTVLVTPDGERTMFTHLGSSMELAPGDIDASAIRSSQWLYVEGYLWDSPGTRAASLKAMETAKTHGVKVSYSFSDSFCVRRALADFREFTRAYVDLVFCNEEEALAFSSTDRIDEAIRDIEGLGAAVALTRGSRGSIISADGKCYEITPLAVSVVDTTGAGDCYAAGVLYGLTHGYGWEDAGRLASRIAAQVVTVSGPRLPVMPAVPGQAPARSPA
ncbi:MAG: adenosine kinase [Deltaproteobacteria bacterium]|nr:adenosine kinase [Deltaproteobacteria bacterium]